jgi:hypothetical protein
MWVDRNSVNQLVKIKSQRQRQSYITTDSQSANLSWCQAPIWEQRPIFPFFLLYWQLQASCRGAPSLTRGWICNLLVQLLLGLARAVTLWSGSRRTQDHILLSHLRLPQPGGPGPSIYIPQEEGGPVIPPGTGFPFCRLLRLAGLRWKYSNPPPDGELNSLLNKPKFLYCLYNLTKTDQNEMIPARWATLNTADTILRIDLSIPFNKKCRFRLSGVWATLYTDRAPNAFLNFEEVHVSSHVN